MRVAQTVRRGKRADGPHPGPARRARGERGNAADDAALKKQIAAFDGKVDAVRKRIVATTEGGAITGEERLREHTDNALRRDPQLRRCADRLPGRAHRRAARRELADIDAQFDALLKQDLPVLNTALAAGGMRAIDVPAEVAETAESVAGSGGGQRDGNDEDEDALTESLPREMVTYR